MDFLDRQLRINQCDSLWGNVILTYYHKFLLANIKNIIILFVCPSKILRKQFLLGPW